MSWLWKMLATMIVAHLARTFGTRENNDANDMDVYWKVLDCGDIRQGGSMQHVDRWKAIAMIYNSSNHKPTSELLTKHAWNFSTICPCTTEAIQPYDQDAQAYNASWLCI
ncbi:hypothetical protein HD554DRAFT_2040749 [Boletus coccyginus]|nr:hypothetical protein HD554DRAFT_2040749 [Boletus coccyginus]